MPTNLLAKQPVNLLASPSPAEEEKPVNLMANTDYSTGVNLLADKKEEAPSWSRQFSYGFSAGSNLITDALDLYEIHYGDGDGYWTDDENLTTEQKRLRVKSVDRAELEQEYQDVIESGTDDSWIAMIANGAKVVADPFMFLPGGAVVKGAYAASKASMAAKAVHKYWRVGVAGGSYATGASVLRQLNEEGTVDGRLVAMEAFGTAIAAPIMIAGAGKVGAMVGNARKERMLGLQGKKAKDLSKKQARKVYQQMLDDMREMHTATGPVEGIPTWITNQPPGELRSKMISHAVSKKNADVLADEGEFLYRAGAYHIKDGKIVYNRPTMEQGEAAFINFVDKEGWAAAAARWIRGTKVGEVGVGTSRFLDKFAGSLDTRIKNISRPVAGALHRTDLAILKRTHEAEVQINAMDDAINKALPDKQEAEALWDTLREQDWDGALFQLSLNSSSDKAARQGAAKAINEMRSTLGGMGEESWQLGMIKAPGEKKGGKLNRYIEDYFPRRVNDTEGLLNVTTKGGQKAVIDKALDDELKRLGKKKLTDLSSYERETAIGKAIRATNPKVHAPKRDQQHKRTINVLQEEHREFYHTAQDGLRLYMRDAIDEIESRKFLGITQNSGKTGKKATQTPTDELLSDESVRSLLAKENLSSTQQREMVEMLQARFGAGRRHSSKGISNTKAVLYGGLLGNVVSAMQQVGDVGISMAVNGMRPTLQAAVHRLTGKKLTNIADEGIAVVAHDIATGGIHTRLSKVMKYSGFAGTDRLMKNITSEAALLRVMSKVNKKSPAAAQAGADEVMKKYGTQWGVKDGSQLVKDLRLYKKGDELTPLMKEYAATELLELQPIARSALPEKYLQHPDGRLFYTLLTWKLRFLDIARKKSYNLIKEGKITEGTTNLASLGLIVGTLDTGIDYVQDFMKGKPMDEKDFSTKVGEAVAGLFWMNTRHSGGYNKGPVESFTSQIMPNAIPSAMDKFIAPITDTVAGASSEDSTMAEGFKKGVGELGTMTPGLGRMAAPVGRVLTGGKWFEGEEKKGRGGVGRSGLERAASVTRDMGGRSR